MTTKNTGGPAFPHVPEAWIHTHQGSAQLPSTTGGMTLRDYFAAKAMQGMLAATPHDYAFDGDVISEAAYEMADAMLRAREGGAA